MKKKVAFVHNAQWEMYNFRGEMIGELKKRGYDITVIVPPNEGKEHLFTEELGVNLITVPMSRKGTNIKEDFKLLKNLYKIYREEKFDLVYHYTIKPNIYGTLAAKLAGRKSVAITTGLGYVFINKNITSLIAQFLYKFSLTYAEEVWFLNSEDKEIFLEKDLIAESQAFILPSEGVNTKRYIPSAKEIKDGKIKFLMIARVLYDKGFREYVEAAKKIKSQRPDIEFQLLGAIDNGNPSGVPKEEVDEAVEAGILNYLGTTNDVVKVIKEADCIVLPSYREGVSRVLMEAASMEKPIIATNVAGCREVVDEGLTGFLCKAKNSFDLAYKMATLIILSEVERELMGKRARQKIVDEMDLERVIEIYDIKTTQIITGEKEGLTVNLEELLRVKQRKNI